jgi:hypothetical protein
MLPCAKTAFPNPRPFTSRHYINPKANVLVSAMGVTKTVDNK